MRRSTPTLSALGGIAVERHAAACAEIVEGAPVADIVDMLGRMPAPRTLDVLQSLTPDTASRTLASLDQQRARAALSALEPRRAAALLSRMEPEQQRERLALLDDGLAGELRGLAAYPRGTAGSLMDPRVLAFKPEARARDVLKRLRTQQQQRVQDIFLVDEEGRLAGALSLKALALAAPEARLGSLEVTQPPVVNGISSREEVMEVLQTHRVASLPVVDFERQLLGALRQDELIATAAQEASADMLKMFGASKEERALSSPWFAMRKRLPWLEINLLTAFLAAAVVGLFEDTIARVTALAVLLPVVAGQSGNTGAQALAVTMRGLALREIRIRHWLRVAGKELTVGTLNGVAVAATTSVAVFIWSRSPALAAVIGISMIMSMMAAALAGALIPMGLTALGQDPAQSSSIVLTTVTDVVGFFSFLGIATLFLAHLPT